MEFTPRRVDWTLEPALRAEVLDLSFSEMAVTALGFGSRGHWIDKLLKCAQGSCVDPLLIL